jgi:hypothetical protein
MDATTNRFCARLTAPVKSPPATPPRRRRRGRGARPAEDEPLPIGRARAAALVRRACRLARRAKAEVEAGLGGRWSSEASLTLDRIVVGLEALEAAGHGLERGEGRR